MKNGTMATLLLLFCVATTLARSGSSAASNDTPQCKFSVMVKPWGWELPKYDKVISRKPFVALEHHPALSSVYKSDLGKAGAMNLPWYYVEDGRLMLYSFDFRLENVFRFDVDGKPFRYVAFAVGSHVGTAANASWTDRDGDGKFEEFAWIGNAFENFPEWVNRRKGNGTPQ